MKLVTLKDYFNSVGYRITGGSEYLWECYGKNVFALDATKKIKGKYSFSTGIIFDTKNYKVYQIDSWDYNKKIIYRWINPRYTKKYFKECRKRRIDRLNDKEFKIIDVSANKILRETKNVMNK